MSTDDLAPFVVRRLGKPVPTPTSREERLRSIIDNIDRQRALVRRAIIDDAKDQLRAQSVSVDSTDPDAMDMDHRVAYLEPDEAGLELTYQNLNASWSEAQGDPGMVRSADGRMPQLPPPPAGLTQETPPAEILAAQVALERISSYERRSRQAPFGRDYSQQAWDRMHPPRRSSESNSAPRARPGPHPADCHAIGNHGLHPRPGIIEDRRHSTGFIRGPSQPPREQWASQQQFADPQPRDR